MSTSSKDRTEYFGEFMQQPACLCVLVLLDLGDGDLLAMLLHGGPLVGQSSVEDRTI